METEVASLCRSMDAEQVPTALVTNEAKQCRNISKRSVSRLWASVQFTKQHFDDPILALGKSDCPVRSLHHKAAACSPSKASLRPSGSTSSLSHGIPCNTAVPAVPAEASFEHRLQAAQSQTKHADHQNAMMSSRISYKDVLSMHSLPQVQFQS